MHVLRTQSTVCMHVRSEELHAGNTLHTCIRSCIHWTSIVHVYS